MGRVILSITWMIQVEQWGRKWGVKYFLHPSDSDFHLLSSVHEQLHLVRRAIGVSALKDGRGRRFSSRDKWANSSPVYLQHFTGLDI